MALEFQTLWMLMVWGQVHNPEYYSMVTGFAAEFSLCKEVIEQSTILNFWKIINQMAILYIQRWIYLTLESQQRKNMQLVHWDRSDLSRTIWVLIFFTDQGNQLQNPIKLVTLGHPKQAAILTNLSSSGQKTIKSPIWCICIHKQLKITFGYLLLWT